METTVYQSNIIIFHKSLDLLISSILNNNKGKMGRYLALCIATLYNVLRLYKSQLCDKPSQISYRDLAWD